MNPILVLCYFPSSISKATVLKEVVACLFLVYGLWSSLLWSILWFLPRDLLHERTISLNYIWLLSALLTPPCPLNLFSLGALLLSPQLMMPIKKKSAVSALCSLGWLLFLFILSFLVLSFFSSFLALPFSLSFHVLVQSGSSKCPSLCPLLPTIKSFPQPYLGVAMSSFHSSRNYQPR